LSNVVSCCHFMYTAPTPPCGPCCHLLSYCCRLLLLAVTCCQMLSTGVECCHLLSNACHLLIDAVTCCHLVLDACHLVLDVKYCRPLPSLVSNACWHVPMNCCHLLSNDVVPCCQESCHNNSHATHYVGYACVVATVFVVCARGTTTMPPDVDA
jgi:hypothetical protein